MRSSSQRRSLIATSSRCLSPKHRTLLPRVNGQLGKVKISWYDNGYIYIHTYIYNRVYIYIYIYNRTYIYILRTILIYTNWMSYIHFWELTRHVYFDIYIYIYNTQHIWYEGYTTIIWYIYWVVQNGVCHGIPVYPSNGIFNGASSSYFQTNSILQRT